MDCLYCLCCFLLFLLTGLSEAYNVTRISNLEYAGLESLFNSTRGSDWNWRDPIDYGPKWFQGTDPCSEPCWQGLTCECNLAGNCTIVEISLDRYRLIGSLPASIDNFENLTYLDLSHNYFTSSLPDSIGKLSYLEYLIVNRSHIVGSIPMSLFSLRNLVELDLSNNELSGSIHVNIGNLTCLQKLDLGSNSLTGVIPPSIGALRSLKLLDLNSNNLRGVIPDELYNLRNVTSLFIYTNKLAGTLSPAIGNMTALKYLYMQVNKLEGSLPSTIGQLYNLRILDVTTNLLTGPIPEELYTIPKLRGIYLQYNSMTGTLSNSIGQLTGLSVLAIYNNFFSGPLPPGLSGCKDIIYLNLASNNFTGTIPESWYNFHRMTFFVFDNNQVTGTISNSIRNMPILTGFEVANNHFTGTIPDVIGDCQFLSKFSVGSNNFTGSISNTFCNVANFLDEFNCTKNLLTGTIPSCLFTDIRLLTGFYLGDNMFSGRMPSNISDDVLSNLQLFNNQLTGPLPEDGNAVLQYFEVYNNLLTGTIPEQLFYKSKNKYTQIELNNNFFTGTISDHVGYLNVTQYLDLSNNHFSGTIPKELASIQVLQIFFVNNNHLSGKLDCFSSDQQYLSNINLSNNEFTGTLPAEPFLNTSLLSFAAVSNCFTGTIPEAICNATALTALALDGLYTASACQIPLVPLISNSYALGYYFKGDVPACLFSMKNIETLHVSGNGLKSPLPFNLEISKSLTDLALSYNQFTSVIPDEIGEIVFDKLDLSFNRLTGVLPTTTQHMNSNVSIYYQVNRLSGHIPTELVDVNSIAILNGNYFECDMNRHQLPKNDKQFTYYDCGTSSLQHTSYAWLAMFLASSIVAVILMSSGKCQQSMKRVFEWRVFVISKWTSWMKVYKVTGDSELFQFRLFNLALFGNFMDCVRISFLLVSLFVAVVLMPVNVSLSHLYGTYLYKYAWNVASVYLSGLTPAVVLLVFFLWFILWLFGAFYYYMVSFTTADNLEDKTEMASSEDDIWKFRKHYFGLMLIAIFNFIVVLAINIGYVFVSTSYGSAAVVLTQISLASFKLIWNDLAIRNMTSLMHQYLGRSVSLSKEEEHSWEGKYMTFNTATMIFNVIVIPCLATAAVSADCFYDVISQPSPVESSFSYKICATPLSAKDLHITKCSDYETVTETTSYSPPYMYRYQCASTLVTTYAVLYVFKFIIAAFIQPLAIVLIVQLCKYLSENSSLYKLFDALVPQVYKTNTAFVNGERKIFHKDRFNLRMIMYLSILVTFGVIFPPLSVMIWVAVCVQTYCSQLSIGRMVDTTAAGSDDRKRLLKNIDEDCSNVAVIFKLTVYAVGPSASFLYSFIIFDTYGDKVGGTHALWMAVLMFVLGCSLSLAFKLWVMREPKSIRNVRLYSSSYKIEMRDISNLHESPMHLEKVRPSTMKKEMC